MSNITRNVCSVIFSVPDHLIGQQCLYYVSHVCLGSRLGLRKRRWKRRKRRRRRRRRTGLGLVVVVVVILG